MFRSEIRSYMCIVFPVHFIINEMNSGASGAQTISRRLIGARFVPDVCLAWPQKPGTSSTAFLKKNDHNENGVRIY